MILRSVFRRFRPATRLRRLRAWLDPRRHGPTPAQRGRLVAVLALVGVLAGLLMYERLQMPLIELPADAGAGASPSTAPSTAPPSSRSPASLPVDAASGAGDDGAATDAGGTGEESGSSTAIPAGAAAHPPDPLRPVPGEVLRGFEVHYSPQHGDFRLHPGVDLAARAGDAVVAAWSGKVVSVEDLVGVGRAVTIDHGSGRQSVYAPLTDVRVAVGDSLRRGQEFARVGPPHPGDAGMPPHLHFELRRDGAPIDPGLR